MADDRAMRMPRWTDGPPKSEIEGWNYERRSRIESIALNIATAMLAGKGRDAAVGHDRDDLRAIAQDAVFVAKTIIEAADEAQPRL